MKRMLMTAAIAVALAGGATPAAWARATPPAVAPSAEAERLYRLSLAEAEPQERFTLMRLAAEQGHPDAAWEVGMMLLNGYGVAQSDEKAAAYVYHAARAGSLQGQISWGVMLALGQGVEEDDAEARVWYRRAAERGSAHALRSLGYMLVSGEGGPVEFERGVAYLELGLEGGDRNAGLILEELSTAPSAAQRREIDAVKAQWRASFGAPGQG